MFELISEEIEELERNNERKPGSSQWQIEDIEVEVQKYHYLLTT
jgi:hypothetical protein